MTSDMDIPLDESSEHMNFTNSYQSIPVRNLSISKTKLTSPFIIETKFKLYKASSSFMFSLEDKNKTPQLALKFSPGVANVMRIALLRKTDDPEVVFQVTNITGDFHNVLLFVEKDKLTLYLDCIELDSRDTEEITVLFDEDSHFVVGSSEVYEAESTFPVSLFYYSLLFVILFFCQTIPL